MKIKKMRLIIVSIIGGRSNKEWTNFLSNVKNLNGKSPDYGGITSMALVSTHHDDITIKYLLSENMESDKDISCVEITKKTLNKDHKYLTDMVYNYFLKYNDYPNIK